MIKNFAISIILQFVLFTPFYLNWVNDCREIGRQNLAVSLSERFVAWMAFCPMWLIGLFS